MAWGRTLPRGTRVIDRFAEALAETGDVPAAAEQHRHQARICQLVVSPDQVRAWGAGAVSAADICERIDAALEKMAFQGLEVRAIYLSPEDDEAYVKAHTRFWRKALNSRATFYPTTYRNHFVRSGKTSVIYSIHGVGFAIPKRLSPRTKAAA